MANHGSWEERQEGVYTFGLTRTFPGNERAYAIRTTAQDDSVTQNESTPKWFKVVHLAQHQASCFGIKAVAWYTSLRAAIPRSISTNKMLVPVQHPAPIRVIRYLKESPRVEAAGLSSEPYEQKKREMATYNR